MKKLKRSLNEAVEICNSSKDSDEDISADKEEAKRIKGRKQHRLWKQQKLEKKLLKQQQKLEKESESANETFSNNDEKIFKHTVSIAVPGSIMCNAQTEMLKSYLAGQIARAAAIYQVDEIVIFDDMGITRSSKNDDLSEEEKLDLSKIKIPCIQMGIILQYLECPQYLRKHLFKMQGFLEYAGVLNPLDMPHHLKKTDVSLYREGIVTSKKAKPGQCLVYIGLQKEVHIDKEIQSNVRVTVKLNEATTISEKKLKGIVVSPSCPRNETGIYWGYSVRLAHSLGSILTECPYEGGYDLTIGTSDKGDSIYDYEIPNFKHMLIVFGGLAGLEASLEADEGLKVEDPKLLFTAYLNTCPSQGTKVIRTEEALGFTLAVLKNKLKE